MAKPLIVETVGMVRILTLDRPEARNALSGDLVRALHTELLAADAAENVRVVILTGSDPAFCAGLDLKQAAAEGGAYFSVFDETDCINQVARMAKPVIGAVNGAAFTGGLEIALGCDFLVASERAVFGDTHVRVGVLPGGGMTARLPAVMGSGNARRMSMTAEVVGAAAALRLGLVTEVVAHDRLRDRVLELAHGMAEVPARTMLGLKRMYVEGARYTVDHAADVERRVGPQYSAELGGLDQRRLAVMDRNRAQRPG